MREDRFHPGSARRPLPGVLSTHRGPVPHHTAQQDLQAVPLVLDGPRGLRSRPRWAPCLPTGLLSGVSGRDDCSATKTLTQKKNMLVGVSFLGPHADITVWVLTQKYNSGLKDLREQTRWVCLFHCKDRDSFEDCLRENDVIPTREQRALVMKRLSETKHAKLLLKTDQPSAYMVCVKLLRNYV